MGPSDTAGMITSLIPLLTLSIPLAVGNYFLAPQLGKSRALWVILSLIPVFNFFFYGYVWYIVAFHILDCLSRISTRLNA